MVQIIGSATANRARINKEEDLRKTRLETLRRSLQLTNRIMAGRDNVILRFSDVRLGDKKGQAGKPMGESYGVTSGNTITLNVDKIADPLSSQGIANILGLDYHELSHLLLTPADRNIFVNIYQGPPAQRSQNFWGAFALLEEFRVETLMGGKYPSLRKYFAYPVLSLLVANTTPSDMNTRHLLLHGRRYLPRKIRDTFRDAFEKAYGEDKAREVEDCIDKYRFLVFTNPDAYTEGARQIQRMAMILDVLKITPPPAHHSQSGEQSQGTPNEVPDKKESRQDQERMAKSAKKDSDEQDRKEKSDSKRDASELSKEKDQEGGDNDGSEGDDDGGDSSQGSGEQESDSQSDSDSSESGKGSGSGSDSEKNGKDDSGDNSGNPSGGKKPGKGGKEKSQQSNNGSGDSVPNGSPSGAGSDRGGKIIDESESVPETYANNFDLQAAAAQALNDLSDDEDVSAEVKRYQAAMDQSQNGLNSVLQRSPEKNPDKVRQVTSDMFLRSQLIADKLRQLWAKMEAGWEYGVEDGPRLNMMNAAMARDAEDYETIYDEWSPGQQDNSGLEVVIVGDRSYSTCAKVMPADFPKNTRYNYLSESQKQIFNKLPTVINLVSRNIWELMFALQEIEAKVTVIAHDHACYTFYDRQEVVTSNGWYELAAQGGTDPSDAFVEARRILTQSEMPNKLLVDFTDGDWGGDEKLIKENLDQLWDVVKVAVLIGDHIDKFNFTSSFDVVERSAGDILNIISNAVIKIVERNAGI